MSDMNRALAIAVLVLTALSSTSSLAQNPTAGSIEKSSAKPNPLQPQFRSAAEAIWKLRKSHHQSRPLLPR